MELFFSMKNTPVPNYIMPEEYIILRNFTEITEEVFVSGKGNVFAQLVDSTGIDRLGKYRVFQKSPLDVTREKIINTAVFYIIFNISAEDTCIILTLESYKKWQLSKVIYKMEAWASWSW